MESQQDLQSELKGPNKAAGLETQVLHQQQDMEEIQENLAHG